MTKPSAVFWRWTREQQLQRVHPLKEDTADVIKFKVGWNSIIVINMIAAEVVGGAGSKITKAPKFRRHCSIKISCTRTSDPSLSVFQSVGRSDRREIIFFDWQLQTYFLQRGWWVGGQVELLSFFADFVVAICNILVRPPYVCVWVIESLHAEYGQLLLLMLMVGNLPSQNLPTASFFDTLRLKK